MSNYVEKEEAKKMSSVFDQEDSGDFEEVELKAYRYRQGIIPALNFKLNNGVQHSVDYSSIIRVRMQKKGKSDEIEIDTTLGVYRLEGTQFIPLYKALHARHVDEIRQTVEHHVPEGESSVSKIHLPD